MYSAGPRTEVDVAYHAGPRTQVPTFKFVYNSITFNKLSCGPRTQVDLMYSAGPRTEVDMVYLASPRTQVPPFICMQIIKWS